MEKWRKDGWNEYLEKPVTGVWEERSSMFKIFSEEYLPLAYFLVVPSKECSTFKMMYQLFQFNIENKVKMKFE